MKFVNILKLLTIALFVSSSFCLFKSTESSIKSKQNAKFNVEFFSGFFSSLQAQATATKLDGYLKECGASSTTILATLKKLNDDLKRINPTFNPSVTSNTLMYVCDSVRNALRAHMSILRGCKLVYQYFKTYLDIIWKKFLKSRQMGNDIVMDPVMKTIYTKAYTLQSSINDSYQKNNFSNLGKIFADLMRNIEPYNS